MGKPQPRVARQKATDEVTSMYRPASAAMKVSTEWMISIRKHSSHGQEDPWHHINLGKFWLPPSAISPAPSPLTTNMAFCIAACMLVDRLMTSQEPTKSTHLVASARVNVAVKFFEYCWLRGIFRLKDFPVGMWEELQNRYNEGGWGAALDIQSRADACLRNLPEYGRKRIWAVTNKKVRFTSAFARAIGTNARLGELSELRSHLARRVHDQEILSGPLKERGGFGMMVQFAAHLSGLADLPKEYGLGSVPAVNPYLYAKAHGRPAGRTRSLKPEEAATLLSVSYKWVGVYAPAILALLDAVVAGFPRRTRSQSDYSKQCRTFLSELPEARRLGELVGTEITYVEINTWDGQTSVATVVKTLLTACFNIIATMNGRRKDEVIGRAIGLHQESLRSVVDDLGLYECLFYVEKTEHAYVPFYVNEITREAIEVLKRVSSIAWRAHEARTGRRLSADERKLFVMPRFAEGSACTFFNYDKRTAGHLTKLALGEAFALSAHMFRRTYALVFHYRYENATLLALSHQLRHRDLSMTVHYVLEPGSREMVDRAETHWPMPKDRVMANQIAHAKELAKEIAEVGKEKMEEIVLKIIQGAETFSGGFPKLVSRFHQKLARHIEYRNLGANRQAEQLSEALLARGHKPVAFKHGDCNAGGARRSARCFSGADGLLHRERASPVVCATCPYHRVSSEHLNSLKAEAVRLRKDEQKSPLVTIRDARMRSDLTNLERLIALHSARLGII